MLRHVALDPSRHGDHVGQAVVLKLTFLAPSVIRRLRQGGNNELFPDLMNDVYYLTPQRRSELNVNPASRAAVPDGALRNIDAQHLLEAQSLGAELQVGSRTVTDSRLVLHGTHRSLLQFHGISPAREAQRLRPQGD